MRPRIIRPASHEEWLAERSKGIGASDVGAILGISPFESPFSLWLKKTGQVPPEPENMAMKLGHLLEPVVCQLWEEATGEKVIKASAKDIIYVHPERDFMRVTPDRIVRGRKKLVEFKTTVKDIDPDDLPPHWISQCIYQQYVTGIHDCDLAWLELSRRNFNYAHIPYDEEFANLVAERVDEFWNENVLGGKEPDLITVDDFAVKGSDPGKTVEADDEALAQVLSLYKLKKAMNATETDADALANQIKCYIGTCETLEYNGKKLATWKSGARGRMFRLNANNIEEIEKQIKNNEENESQ